MLRPSPVDVLAVLDGTIEGTEAALPALRGKRRDECEDALADLRATRSAAAEMIFAGDRLTAAFRALGLDGSLVNRSRLARECEDAILTFDTALARVKGGAE